MIRALIFMLILLVAFTVVVKNTVQVVVLQYFFGLATPPIPVYQLVAGAFITGMLLTGLLVFPEWIRMRLEIRRLRKSLQRIEEEMARLRPPTPAMSTKHRESAAEGEES
ncbi:MAG TPA: LapA family protein [Nitrospiria bacterium]